LRKSVNRIGSDNCTLTVGPASPNDWAIAFGNFRPSKADACVFPITRGDAYLDAIDPDHGCDPSQNHTAG